MSKQGREDGRSQKAAAIRAAQERKERNRRIALVAGIVVLLGAIVAGGAWYSSGGGSTPSAAAAEAPVSAGATSLTVGKPDAPVKVVIYEDFQCPYCRELENSTRTFLRENAAKGRVVVEYQPINLLSSMPYSAKALNAWAAVLENASAKAALRLHDLLYDHQPYEQDSASVTDGQIAGWVKDAGGDNPDVRAAMTTQNTAFFSAAGRLMSAKGIQGTPTVMVDGKELSASSMSDMAQQIETAVDNG